MIICKGIFIFYRLLPKINMEIYQLKLGGHFAVGNRLHKFSSGVGGQRSTSGRCTAERRTGTA